METHKFSTIAWGIRSIQPSDGELVIYTSLWEQGGRSLKTKKIKHKCEKFAGGGRDDRGRRKVELHEKMWRESNFRVKRSELFLFFYFRRVDTGEDKGFGWGQCKLKESKSIK